MSKELQKRILTSIVLILLISLSIYLGPLAIMIALLIVSYVTYSEFSYLIDKIYKYSHIKHLLRHVAILFYCFVIFFISTFILTMHFYYFLFVLSICISLYRIDRQAHEENLRILEERNDSNPGSGAELNNANN